MAFVDLHGIAATHGDVRAGFAGKVDEICLATGAATGARMIGDDLGMIVAHTSSESMLRRSLSRAPTRNFNVSVTVIDAKAFTAEFRMPDVSQVSTTPRGESGKMQARHAVSCGSTFMVSP